MFLSGQTAFGSYFEFEKRYMTELGGDDRQDHVFHISYEELKRDAPNSLQALGAFLGVERTPDFYAEVASKTQFQNIKAAREESTK